MKKSREQNDQALIRDLQGPHKDAERAFTEIYSRYAHRAYALILSMTGDSAASQDLLQEVFLKFYNATRQELVFTNPGGFILMIARNLCLNWKRDESRVVPLKDLPLTVDEYNIEHDELLHLITLALDLLEFDYREAFVLKYYQGYSYGEMVSLTGETVPTLKNRVWRAKEQIKQVLRPYILETQK
ncbi:MAG: RNA polymerase sigma factor [Ignavibacteriota bacterium]